MKYLKQKLMAAVAMLAVSTVMLTSASYAWFTISVTPEVKTVTTNITANENFEIAWGTDALTTPDEYFAALTETDKATNTTGKDNTWGATITSIPALTGLGPAKVDTTEKTIQTVEYGEDGRPAGLKNVNRALFGTTPTTIANGVAPIKDFDDNVIGQTILVWLRTNVAGSVTVDVSNVSMAVAAGDDRKHLVKTAFEVCTFNDTTVVATGKVVEAVVGANDVRTASLGSFAANTAIPVLVHVYLDGDVVTNADIASDYLVTLGSIKFTNDQIAGDESYEHNELNVKQ